MTKCRNCIHQEVYPTTKCGICIATRNLKWELQSVQDECEQFEPTRQIVDTSEYKASHYQTPKEFNSNQMTFKRTE